MSICLSRISRHAKNVGSQSFLFKIEKVCKYANISKYHFQLPTYFSFFTLHTSYVLQCIVVVICVRPTNETRKTHNKVVGLWRPIFSFFVVSFFTQ